MAIDPICGMKVRETDSAITAEYKGKKYYFCAPGCKKEFLSSPDNYIENKKPSFFSRLKQKIFGGKM